MQVSTRSYLTAGLSFVAAGAIIATPMSPPAPQQEPSHPLVRNQQVQLAALVSPITMHNVAGNPAAVHVLAEASRTFQSAKTANATSAVGGTSASPSVARTKVAQPAAAAAIPARAKAAPTGAVTTQDPETGDAPSSDAGQSSTAGSLVTNAIDPAGVGNVLASAAQVAIDTFIGVPAGVFEQTAFNVDTFFFEVATLDPNNIGDAFSDFFANESADLQDFGGILGDDFTQLQDSISHLFGVDDGDDGVSALAADKTATKTGAIATSAASGAADETPAKPHQGSGLDANSKGALTGKHSQEVSAKPAKSSTPGQTDDPAAKESDADTKDEANPKTTDAAENDSTKDDTTKNDTTKPSGKSTSTSTSIKHNTASSTVNGATKDKGATKTKSSTHTASHAAGPGKHSGTKGGHSGHGGHGGK